MTSRWFEIARRLPQREVAAAGIGRRAGLDSSKTIHALDFCHAAHHISLALAALGLIPTILGTCRQITRRR